MYDKKELNNITRGDAMGSIQTWFRPASFLPDLGHHRITGASERETGISHIKSYMKQRSTDDSCRFVISKSLTKTNDVDSRVSLCRYRL